MSQYKVKISVELVECNEAVSDIPIEQRDGRSAKKMLFGSVKSCMANAI